MTRRRRLVRASNSISPFPRFEEGEGIVVVVIVVVVVFREKRFSVGGLVDPSVGFFKILAKSR